MRVLNKLSSIEDIKDFRVREFMKELNMDPTQPVLFYRELIKEAREVGKMEAELSTIRTQNNRLYEENTKLRAEKNEELEKQRQISLQWQIEHAILRKEFEQAKQHIAALTEERTRVDNQYKSMQWKYRGFMDFLCGVTKPETLKAVLDALSDIYNRRMDMELLKSRSHEYGLPCILDSVTEPARIGRGELEFIYLRDALREDYRKALKLPPVNKEI